MTASLIWFAYSPAAPLSMIMPSSCCVVKTSTQELCNDSNERDNQSWRLFSLL